MSFSVPGLYGRSQVIHFAMSLLVSWVYSGSEVDEATFHGCDMLGWLKNLLLADPDPSVRREICTGVYRLCLGSASNGSTGFFYLFFPKRLGELYPDINMFNLNFKPKTCHTTCTKEAGGFWWTSV